MQTRSRLFAAFLAAQCLAHVTSARTLADEDRPPTSQPNPHVSAPAVVAARQSIARGLAYLASTQDPSGGWTAEYGPAVTALVAEAFSRDERYGPDHAIVRRAVASIMRFEQSDGGIYEKQNNLANYQTSIVLGFLSRLNGDEHKPRIAKAQAFLKKLQYDDAESIDRENPWYGGAGYNESKRPDLSNTQMMVEALRRSGLPTTDPVYQRALVFISRCQMNDATNDLALADGASEGGFIYSPNKGGESKAGKDWIDRGIVLRPYGTMTYAGFKSLLYCDVKRDDPRMVACLKWIREHYTLDVNPNMPGVQRKEGLFYYYHVFAKSLRAWGEPTLTDSAGVKHPWREELIAKLISLQKSDGHWSNHYRRFLEGNADYVTALAVLSMEEALAAEDSR